MVEPGIDIIPHDRQMGHLPTIIIQVFHDGVGFLVVPRSAVLPDDEKQVLFTVKNGKAVKHEVKTGITNDDFVEVLSHELHEGDLVVSLGNYELEDGMAIQPAEKAEKPDDAKDEKKPDAKDPPKAGKAPEAKP